MDLSKLKNVSAKNIAIFGSIVIIALVIVLSAAEYEKSSLGLSGNVTSRSVSVYPSAPSMRVAGMAANMAYDSIAESAPQMMPVPMPTNNAPAGESKIIKNGDLALVVERIDDAAKMIRAVREKYNGLIGNESFSDYATARTGDMIIWVPSENFEKALAEIKVGALRVENERITVSDVSAQFVDMEARLKNLRVTEAQIQELMRRSGKISEVLEVSRELSNTRAQIEQIQGQLNYLSRQVALSSIHISLTEELTAPLGKNEWRPLSVIRAAWRDTLRDLTNFVDVLLVLLVKLPLLLVQIGIWVGVIYFLWRIGVFAYRRVKGQTLS